MILIICSAACIAVFGACKVDIVGYHFHSGAVVAVLILILAGLKTAFNGDQTALLEILANKLGLDVYKRQPLRSHPAAAPAAR